MSKRVPFYASLAALGLLIGWLCSAPQHALKEDPLAVAASVKKAPTPISHVEMVPDESKAVEAFAEWFHRYELASESDRALMNARGEQLAQERRVSLYSLIKRDPKAALSAALAEPSRRLLPESVTRWLERPISARGELAVVAATPQPGMKALIKRPTYREARIGDQHFDAYVYGRRAKQDTKYGTSLLGIAIDDRMAVKDEPARVVTVNQLPRDTALEPTIIAGEDESPSAFTAETPILQVQGKAYPVCCKAHAAALASLIIRSESRPGPHVEAFGGSVASTVVAAPAPAPAAASAASAHTVLVILADFSDATGAPVDVATSATISSSYATTRLTGDVSDFLYQASYGKFTVGSVTVTGLLRMPGTLASYASTDDSAKLKSDALAAAASFHPDNFDHVAVVFKSTNSVPGNQFTWAGLADLGGNFLWFNGYFNLDIVSHEMSHNFSMRHANLWRIPEGSVNPVDPAGASEEYGDPFDVMGSGPGDASTQANVPNPWALNRIQWLADSAVQTVTTSGTYRVYRYDHKDVNQSNTLALKIGRNASTDYWVALRRKYAGHPTLSDVSNGAYIFWGYQDNVPSDLIDIDTPGHADADASLNVGSTFNDTAAGVSFTVNSIGGIGVDQYMDVSVSFQPRILFAPPVLSVDEISGSITVKVERRNNSSGAVSAHYASVAGTATAGSDYTSVSGDLTWADGDSSPREIVVPIIADGVKENPETFSIVLSSVTGAVVADGSTVTITIEESGNVDPTFTSPSLTSAVRAITVHPSEKIGIAGYFTTSDNIDGVALLNSNGTENSSFNRGPGLNIVAPSTLPEGYALVREPDGKLLVGGNYTKLRNITRNRIARLNEDGTLDATFDAGVGPNKTVNTIVVQPDGKILVGGKFTTWNGSLRAGLVRLNGDGTLDSSFVDFDTVADKVVSTGIEVNAIALQPIVAAPQFRILVGGSFVRPFSSGGWHSGIVALNASNGSRDTTFDSVFGAHTASSTSQLPPVSALAVQPDGKILVGGQFTGFGGDKTLGHIARLTSSGANDTAFNSALAGGVSGSDVSSILVQADGKVVVCGHFSNASGASPSQAVLARYSGAGVFDSLFRPNFVLFDDHVSAGLFGGFSVAMQSESRLLVGLNGYGSGNEMTRVFSSLPQRPSVVQFSTSSVVGVEGGNALLTVQRSGGSLGAISVNYSTLPRSASAGADYTTTTGTLTWADGDAAPKTITVPVAFDAFASEPSETFDVWLANPIGGMLFGDRQFATVTITEADLSTIPHVQFGINSGSVTESAGALLVSVIAAPASASSFTIPIAYSGTATQGTGKDYLKGADSVTFAAGETSKTVTVTVLQDVLLESTETINLSLGVPVGTAVLDSNSAITLSILDDEALPSISVHPTSRIVPVGSSTTFNVTASGNPAPAYQWRKSTSNVGTGPSYTISNVQTSHGGSYNVVVKNSLSGVVSNSADLAVIDQAPKVINAAVGSNVTLTLSCSSNVTSFQWAKNGVPLTDVVGHITGSNKKSMTITKVANASVGPPPVMSDADTYTCTISIPSVSAPATSGTFLLNVLDAPPDITDTFTLPDAMIGCPYDVDIPYDPAQNRTPTSFSVSPALPSGLKLNTTTGKISGTPNGSLTKETITTYTFKAINAKGYDPKIVTLKLKPLPDGTVGTYVGYLPRSADVNSNLGGRFDLTISSNGIYSGKLTNGSTAQSFSGYYLLSDVTGAQLPRGAFRIVRTSTPPDLIVEFSVDSANDKLSSLTVKAGGNSVSGFAWRNVTPASGHLDIHTFAMSLAVPDSGMPQGWSHGSYTVASTGKLTVSGKLSDGVAFSTAGHISKTGEVLVHQVSTSTDTIVGKLTQVPGVDTVNFTDDSLTGTISWSRKAQTTASTQRTYGNGFGPVDLNAVGSRYRKPASTEVIMGLTYSAVVPVTTQNGKLAFTDGDFGASNVAPDASILVKPGGSTSVIPDSNADRTTTASMSPSTGVFSGKITLLDVNPVNSVKITRTADYYGIVVRDGGALQGRGFFVLPKVPAAGTSETTSTTKYTSGKVSFDKLP